MFSPIRNSILIGQLTGSCVQNFEELIRGTAKLEQMNWSNIFGMLLLPTVYTQQTIAMQPTKHIFIERTDRNVHIRAVHNIFLQK